MCNFSSAFIRLPYSMIAVMMAYLTSNRRLQCHIISFMAWAHVSCLVAPTYCALCEVIHSPKSLIWGKNRVAIHTQKV